MKKKQLPQNEAQLTHLIIDWLVLQGHFVWKQNSGLLFVKDHKGRQRAFRAGLKGMADIIGCLRDGTFLAIEVKAGYKKPRPEQTEFLDRINQLGGIAFWTNNFEDVIMRLKNL